MALNGDDETWQTAYRILCKRLNVYSLDWNGFYGIIAWPESKNAGDFWTPHFMMWPHLSHEPVRISFIKVLEWHVFNIFSRARADAFKKRAIVEKVLDACKTASIDVYRAVLKRGLTLEELLVEGDLDGQ